MDFCYWHENQSISDTTSQQYFSYNSISSGPYQLSGDMKNPQMDATELSLYGKENYSLARNTEKQILINSSAENIPLELLQIIAEKSNNIEKHLQVFIPYSNDEQLLQYYLKQKKFTIYTLDDDQVYLNKLKKQKIFQQLKYVKQQELVNNFDLKIFNCCSQTDRMFKFLETTRINSISTNQVFILDYCHNLHEIISKIMKDQETYKEELMLVTIKSIKKYYVFFTGKMSSTEGLSRLQTIQQILLEDAESDLNCPNQIKMLLKYLMDEKFTLQKILQIIGSIKQKHADELKKQQSDSILLMFLRKLIKNKIVDQSKIHQIYPSIPINHLTKTKLTSSQKDIIQNNMNSYDRVNNSRFQIKM
ncbi:unnamed protein product (macronuclear) [Paramecium tetraurelia]|uniref:Uncharacterized protein n=1 Tax=Paramecium tetraurelia TaxID=5888 RepID=A0E8D1_PARTE|nr:uncharacterized protein GSPATT00024276001 [Paramecium tetraurelia]CAK91548.1 unnamed protein product [Paramecium tetraurelia]|eukprot:XP_001458945.1 hypothetical protein (macronuclear) [Paramecium tetraurelia strain d4-2]